MNRLPHGYTNFTRRLESGVIEKTYAGTRRRDNARRELACLTALSERLPVAGVVDYDLAVPRLTLTELPGRHGQELIDEGHAARVLRLVGSALATLRCVEVETVPALDGDGPVVVHGDFGPQNMLFDLESDCVSGIVDWESAHYGTAIEDLAWAEWIVRTHHPDAHDALDALFSGARQRPSWPNRHAAMLRQVRDVVAYCESADMSGAAAEWRDRLQRTEAWSRE